jgi:formamidopyrimidine-DNA glycosylase
VPELPEVETVRRQLEPLLRGRRVVDAWGHESAKFSSAADAVGRTIERVGRRGKYLIASLDDGYELVLHLGMTGHLRLRSGTRDPYVRAWWALDPGTASAADDREGSQVLELRDVRRFGRIAVVRAGEYASLPTLAALGPEPWSTELDHGGLWRRLKVSRTRVKTQLLSQRPVAGVGNIYADEALWRAGIHPGRRNTTRLESERLLAMLREVLDQGIANGGTTLRDYRAVDGSAGRNQLELACYGRAGEPCLHCGDELRRSVIDGRGTTYCATCQRRRR